MFYLNFIINLIKIKIKKILFKYFYSNQIPSVPQFSYKDKIFFKKFIHNKKNILEYGMGGSTIFSVKKQKSIISIDTDKNFVSIIKKKLNNNLNSNYLLYADIGETTIWGYPLDYRKNKKNILRWSKYVKSPWSYIGNKFPDVIIVDGRFRVACAAYSLLQMLVKNKGVLIFDDYNTRKYYWDIETIAIRIKKLDRISIFKPKRLSKNIYLKIIGKYITDSR